MFRFFLPHELVVLGCEDKDRQVVPVGTHCVQDAREAAEPGECLLTYVRVDLAQPSLQRWGFLGRLLATRAVAFLVHFVHSVVTDLRQVGVLHASAIEGARSVHDEGVALLVERQHCLQGSCHDVIVLRLFHGLHSEDVLRFRVAQHEPSEARRWATRWGTCLGG